MNYQLTDDKYTKSLKSLNYNYFFNKKTGLFVRWGRTQDDDPLYSAFGPEILDIEITSGGQCKGGCSFCYKSNGGKVPVNNMTLGTFKSIFDKFPSLLTQIAFGIMNINSNPEFNDIMSYARSKGVIPNYTCHGIDTTEQDAQFAKQICGGIAVSIVDKDASYSSIRKYLDAGVEQVNIHYMISEETYDRAFDIIHDISEDDRLEGLNAIVFLQYKPKGRGVHKFTSITDNNRMRKLIQYCNEMNVNYGFDSCSSPLVMKSLKSNKDKIMQFIEPCESTLFSGYINWKGEFFPCSFVEGTESWKEGLKIVETDNFVEDIWNHPKVVSFREEVINSTKGCKNCEFKNSCRKCIVYNSITNCSF